jgi:hypothetical protein
MRNEAIAATYVQHLRPARNSAGDLLSHIVCAAHFPAAALTLPAALQPVK